MKKTLAFGEPRLDAELASIIAASEAAGKPGRAITSPYQKRVVVAAVILAVGAIGLAQWLAEPVPQQAKMADARPVEAAPLPAAISTLPPSAATELAARAGAPAPVRAAARPNARPAHRPSAKTVWYESETSADQAFGKQDAPRAASSPGIRPKAHTVIFADAGVPLSANGKGPATGAVGAE